MPSSSIRNFRRLFGHSRNSFVTGNISRREISSNIPLHMHNAVSSTAESTRIRKRTNGEDSPKQDDNEEVSLDELLERETFSGSQNKRPRLLNESDDGSDGGQVMLEEFIESDYGNSLINSSNETNATAPTNSYTVLNEVSDLRDSTNEMPSQRLATFEICVTPPPPSLSRQNPRGRPRRRPKGISR